MGKIDALSVFDGRYERYIRPLKDIFSEYGLITNRLYVELKWLIFLSKELKLFDLEDKQISYLTEIYETFDIEKAKKVKKIEKETNHDVKAVEYYIKNELEKKNMGKIKEWVHFGCTSEDINNTAYGLMIKNGKKIINDYLFKLIDKIETKAKKYKNSPMMSRTHGQPASPTTVGKEFINFAYRLNEEVYNLKNHKIKAKINGASGNYNAHFFAFDNIDWISKTKDFIENYLSLNFIKYSTQINPYSHISKLFHIYSRAASIIIDFDRDMWGYISFDYFKQKLKEGEVGSSTMPHKVNPIDFENSEGNMGIAISMMNHLSKKLLNSRFQRDLTDSTVLRNIGAIFGYLLIGLKKTYNGLDKLKLNKKQINKDFKNNLELLAEPIQTVMRVYGEEKPYEKMKELTRGKKISLEDISNFIDNLEKVPNHIKEKMKKLTPSKYTGLADKLVEDYFK